MANISEVENGLLFVVGCGRSGTTLLKSILNMHENIFFPAETLFFNSIYNPRTTNLDNVDDRLNTIVDKWWIKDLGVTKKEFISYTNNENLSWEELFLVLLNLLSKNEDKEITIFGEKTPSHVKFIKYFFETYPHCKVIQMIRDPRAVYASYKKAPVGTNQIAGVIKEWDRAITAHFDNEKNERYMSLHYEGLVSSPKQELKKVCDFLGVPFIEEMLSFHSRENKGFAEEQVHHENTMTPLFMSSIDSWESSLTHNQVAVIDQKLGSKMKILGYETKNYPVVLSELRFQFSRLLEYLSRSLIRRPRQKIKKFRALRRIRRENTV